ncbi:hypothetical protein [Phytohalomonas tamaricis]|uniref:hypothetical protein n=1 Tax=Phytohalomonas tamaricis TaxID=2081032 RepID=UPI000D0BC9F0|nr:hypothetical protein [Phytohalomonas tamaricis]
MNAQAQLHNDMAYCRRAGISYEIAAEAQRQRKEEAQAAYEQALDDEVERILTQPDEIQEALGYTLDQSALEHAVVMSNFASLEQRELWRSVLRQHIRDAVCELAKRNLEVGNG